MELQLRHGYRHWRQLPALRLYPVRQVWQMIVFPLNPQVWQFWMLHWMQTLLAPDEGEYTW